MCKEHGAKPFDLRQFIAITFWRDDYNPSKELKQIRLCYKRIQFSPLCCSEALGLRWPEKIIPEFVLCVLYTCPNICSITKTASSEENLLIIELKFVLFYVNVRVKVGGDLLDVDFKFLHCCLTSLLAIDAFRITVLLGISTENDFGNKFSICGDILA